MKKIVLPQPGNIVTCVVGQRYDATWCPNAQVVLLATEENHHTTRFMGVAKNPRGELEILFHVMPRPEGVISDDRGWGDYYSGFGLGYTNGEVANSSLSRFMALIERGLAYHAEVIQSLPLYKEIVGNYRA